MPDKYEATWISHSSIKDFKNCPRAYYLKNIYKNPETGRKITLMNPHLALGQAVHNVLESLSNYSVEERFDRSLNEKLNQEWEKISGDQGGFKNKEQEQRFKKRAEEMIETIQSNPGPLNNLATKRNTELLKFWLSEEEEIILCGMIDWFEFNENDKSVHIIDFKTGKKDKSNDDSLQLPIYYLLARECQKWDVSKLSYWFLQEDKQPESQQIPDYIDSKKQILSIGKKIKNAREEKRFECPNGENGCYHCQPLEKVLSGEAEQVGVDYDFNKDIFIVN
ncbi:MAG: RecB family exonuclease [Candidatus Magasanikbacteria bacterium]